VERWKMWVGHEGLVAAFTALESVELHKVALGTLLIDIRLHVVCRLYNILSIGDMHGIHLSASQGPRCKPRHNKASPLIRLPG